MILHLYRPLTQRTDEICERPAGSLVGSDHRLQSRSLIDTLHVPFSFFSLSLQSFHHPQTRAPYAFQLYIPSDPPSFSILISSQRSHHDASHLRFLQLPLSLLHPDVPPFLSSLARRARRGRFAPRWRRVQRRGRQGPRARSWRMEFVGFFLYVSIAMAASFVFPFFLPFLFPFFFVARLLIQISVFCPTERSIRLSHFFRNPLTRSTIMLKPQLLPTHGYFHDPSPFQPHSKSFFQPTRLPLSQSSKSLFQATLRPRPTSHWAGRLVYCARKASRSCVVVNQCT